MDCNCNEVLAEVRRLHARLDEYEALANEGFAKLATNPMLAGFLR